MASVLSAETELLKHATILATATHIAVEKKRKAGAKGREKRAAPAQDLRRKVLAIIDEPGLHFLWPIMEWQSLIVNWMGKCYVLDMRLEDGSGLKVVEAVRDARPDARVIMLTGYGNIATAVAAVKAGAVDYLAKPADADDVARALLAQAGDRPPPPENPMSADRVRWEHIQRVYELCGHNVSETARRLNMHRRTLQRILAKRAPK